MAQTVTDRFPEDQAPAGQPERGQASIAPIRRDDFDRDVWCLLGLPVDIADVQSAVSEIEGAARDNRRLSFVTPNVNWLVRALKDKEARRQIIDSDLSLVDGAPLAVFARALGVPVKQRTAGSDLFEALRRRPGFQGRRLKVFFFGGRDGAAEQAAKAVNAERGGVEAVGWHNPGFGSVLDMSAPEIIEKINAAAPDFIVVALGAAKGQAWIDHNQERLNAPAMAHLGAVVDFTAGGVARAPEAFQKFGLEWAWRIKEEPSLWKRYFEDGLSLFSIALTRLAPQVMRGRSAKAAAPADAKVTAEAGRMVVTLSGALVRGDLRPVRDAFRAAAAQNTALVLDLSSVVAMDRAFLGLVLMLEKHLSRQNKSLTVAGVTSAQKVFLRANAMNYGESELRLKANRAIELPRRAAI